MAGYIKLHRGWRDNPVLDGEYSRGDAWVWLIENAAWKPTRARIKGATITIERGELSFSVRFLADIWGWSKSRVDRFLSDLRDEGMIETRSKIGTDAGTISGTSPQRKAGQGQSIIRLCNYDKYQSLDDDERDEVDQEAGTVSKPLSGTSAGRARDERGTNKEEGKKDKKGNERASALTFDLPDWVPPDAWAGFEDMRKRIKKPLTARARELAIAKLNELRQAGNDPGAVLDRSVLNSWQGLFELPRQNGGGGGAAHTPSAPMDFLDFKIAERREREEWKRRKQAEASS